MRQKTTGVTSHLKWDPGANFTFETRELWVRCAILWFSASATWLVAFTWRQRKWWKRRMVAILESALQRLGSQNMTFHVNRSVTEDLRNKRGYRSLRNRELDAECWKPNRVGCVRDAFVAICHLLRAPRVQLLAFFFLFLGTTRPSLEQNSSLADKNSSRVSISRTSSPVFFSTIELSFPFFFSPSDDGETCLLIGRVRKKHTCNPVLFLFLSTGLSESTLFLMTMMTCFGRQAEGPGFGCKHRFMDKIWVRRSVEDWRKRGAARDTVGDDMRGWAVCEQKNQDVDE